ncbi:LAQU0S24e00276g1_1 [Lachancea quebecensis]|uniref:ATP-dependent DNA helicase CHL1 n=1 Tax=Lachancea quebecensis TaxID=1654605 RepID=A0A0P1L6K3_9SACH|nr:LAQU0S24e00276g1_1 [Lachancea quebecensis]
MNGENNYGHPFKPYDIQLQLMHQVYSTLENGKKIGIFESPTGTGKTLSLICPTVTWLRNNKAHYMGKSKEPSRSVEGDPVKSDDESDDEPAWVKEAFAESVIKEKVRALDDYEKYLASKTFKAKYSSIYLSEDIPKVKRKRNLPHTAVSFEDSEFLPDENSSSGADSKKYSDVDNDKKKKLINEVNSLLGKLDQEAGSLDEEVQTALPSPIKIFYASRTHSQLGQLASQLRLPDFPPSFERMEHERVKFVPLASRKQLCIHPKVSKTPNQVINDYCRDAVSKKECVPYTRSKDPETLHAFRDFAFYAIHDIEDIVSLGRATDTCPYYALRELLHDGVEVVTLPYQHLLVESTREALGIDLRDSIVIIDEAHNLIDTINAVNSAEVSLVDLQSSKLGIMAYEKKFAKRLSPRNRVNLKRLLTLVEILIAFLEQHYKNGKEFEGHDVFAGTNADILNIHKLEQYMKTTKIAYKIDSYTKSQNEGTEQTTVGKQPVLFKVASFLKTLSNPSLEGQFFFEKGKVMKYMLLEPSNSFKPIVQDARCVLLAGGTMEPISDFTRDLIPFVDENQINKFTCNHVIPDNNLNTFIVAESFEFTFDKREDSKTLSELYCFFSRLVKIVPDGVVVFLPSYKFLESLMRFWSSTCKVGACIGDKRIFHESADQTDVFGKYAEEVRKSTGGAILFAVVGGRLSEGINFQNELARAVVMVGLPYPNLFSGELIIKRKHLEQKVLSAGGSEQDAKKATREFYENICMKAVNQSIGRAIRHAQDYANIYLVDKRYSSVQVQKKLSNWVAKRIRHTTSLGELFEESAKWYADKAQFDH